MLAAAEQIPVDLKLIPAGEKNTIELTITGDVLGTVQEDSDTAPVSGNMLATLGLSIDPENYDVLSVDTIEFTGGRIAIGDTSFGLDWFLIGGLDIVVTGLGGTLDTPNPPGLVAAGSFNAADHQVILDTGQFEATGSGLIGGFMPANPYAVDLSQEPTTVTTEATGSIVVSAPTIAGGQITYDVTLTLPLTMDEVVFEQPDQASMRISGTTTLEARGQIVLVADHGKAAVPAFTGLEEADVGATSFARGAGDQEIEWAAETLQVTTSAAVEGTFKDPANPRNLHQFHLNNASMVARTERIDVRASSDVQVSIDLRTWDTSTGFEAEDGITLSVLVSRDGILFEEKPWTELRGAEATALNKGRDGSFSTLRTPEGFIPEDADCIRLVISASTNSNNEHLFWDNIRVGPPVPFRRGDCDASGEVDLADAVRALFWLFSSGVTPPCLDACDSSDDGKVNITDALFTLGWLFRGGPIPPAPGPFSCGFDGTPAASASCESYPGCP
jgi:hypothetical protein